MRVASSLHMTHRHLLTLVVSAAAVLGAAGCATRNQDAVRPDLSSTGGKHAPKPAASAPSQGADRGVTHQGDDAIDAAPLYYALDSAQLTSDSQERLRGLAEFLRRHPDRSVRISGHTCDLGTSEYNLALGQKRAHAARDYLVALGVSPARVNALTLGEERPADEGDDEASRQRNRRSELELGVADGQATR